MSRARQRGSMLGAAMVLLASLATLALAAAATVLGELAILGHQQAEVRAFEAAEATIAAMLQGAATGVAPGAEAQAQGIGPPPPGYSLAGDGAGFVSLHYLITAEGRGPREVRVVLEQGYRRLGSGT